MRKRLFTLAALVGCVITIGAQTPRVKTKMSPWLHAQYVQNKATKQQRYTHARSSSFTKTRSTHTLHYTAALVQTIDNAMTLRQKGGVVWQNFGNGICAAFLPNDSLGALDRSPAILRMEANKTSQILNDTSTVIIGVDKARKPATDEELRQPGPHLIQAFTGKGVIAAVMDVGFDLTHPAFRDDDGKSRIKWFWDPMAPDANNDVLGQQYNTSEEVLAARHCINADVDNHGTHVMGSMAGRGLDGRYVGMAPDADIIGAYYPLGRMSDEFCTRLGQYLADHLDDEFADLDSVIIDVDYGDVIELIQLYEIFRQADAAGQPCVVNWSFGIDQSPTQDFTLYEQVLNSMLGPGRIVVAAAGNSGHNHIYEKKEADTPMDQYAYFYTSGGAYFSICTDTTAGDFETGIWFDGMSDTIYVSSRSIVEAMDSCDYLSIDDPDMFVAASAEMNVFDKVVYCFGIYPQGDFADSIVVDTTQHMMLAQGKIMIDAPVEVELRGESGSWGLKLGKESYYNSPGCQLSTLGYPSALKRVISVGAMHHRTDFININGDTATTLPLGSEEGHLASFSSCGPTLDYRVKPDVVAPGFNIISTLNSFYCSDDPEYDDQMLTYVSKAYGRDYGMFAMSGTSMATPITTGVIALWLQAKPDLTPEDIMGVIQRTSHQPDPEFSGYDKNNYYGWGEIDAYEGLLDILGVGTAVPELSKHQPAGIAFRLEGHTLYIDGLETDGQLPIVVYDLSGKPVFRGDASSGIVSLPALPAGVYAVQLGKKGSTLIRIE